MHITPFSRYIQRGVDWHKLRCFTLDSRTMHLAITHLHYTTSGLLVGLGSTPQLKPPGVVIGPEGTVRCFLPKDNSPLFQVIGLFQLPESLPVASKEVEVLHVEGDAGEFKPQVYEGLCRINDHWTPRSFLQVTGSHISENQLRRLIDGIAGPW